MHAIGDRGEFEIALIVGSRSLGIKKTDWIGSMAFVGGVMGAHDTS